MTGSGLYGWGRLPAAVSLAVNATGQDEQVAAPGAYEQVDHPAHYQHQSGVEAITVCEWMTFNLGNVVKYVMRAGAKPGTDALTDLRKARFYLDREIARLDRDGP